MKPVCRVLLLVGILSIAPGARAEPQEPAEQGISLSELAAGWLDWMLEVIIPASSTTTSGEPEAPEPPPEPPPASPQGGGGEPGPGYGGVGYPGG